MNIADVLIEHARKRPDHPAIEDGGNVVSYAELDEQATQTAANLQAEGLVAGDVVAIMLPDSADHLITLCALARAGIVIMSLHPNLSAREVGQTLTGVAVKAAIAHSPIPTQTGLRNVALKDIRRPSPDSFAPPDVGDKDPAILIQSSGTTGAPKSFIRSHAEMIALIGRYARSQHWTSDDRCLCLSLMTFDVGRNVSLGMLHVGATVVINHAGTLNALKSVVREKRISYLKLTPSHVVPMLGVAADKVPLFPGLRAMVVGSAPTTHEQRLLARQRLTPNFCEQLGSNEAGLLAFATPDDQDAFPESVGRLADGVEAEIVDENDQPVETGAVGLVRFKADGYPTAYFDDPEATARAFRNGWFYPGDLAALNEQGYLFFKGRADDVINNAGAKFYPIEVESALLAHPDVTEAAAFGWPHERLGEVAAACVVTRSPVSKRELQAFCSERIAGYKVPQVVAKVTNMPKNAMGKILKSELKKKLELSASQPRRRDKRNPV